MFIEKSKLNKELIGDEIKYVIDEIRKTSNTIPGYSVEPYSLVDELGISFECNSKDHLGILEYRDIEFVIRINTINESKNIGEMITYLCVYKFVINRRIEKISKDYCSIELENVIYSESTDDIFENQILFISRCLLMPKDPFIYDFEKEVRLSEVYVQYKKEDIVFKLANKYSVTEEFVVKRMKDLDLKF